MEFLSNILGDELIGLPYAASQLRIKVIFNVVIDPKMRDGCTFQVWRRLRPICCHIASGNQTADSLLKA